MRRFSKISAAGVLIRLCACLTIAAAFLPVPSVQAGDKVRIRISQSATIDITINGRPARIYNYGETLPKPYLLPVRTRPRVSSSIENSESIDADHPHHKGVAERHRRSQRREVLGGKRCDPQHLMALHSTDAESASPTGAATVAESANRKAGSHRESNDHILYRRLVIYDMTFTASWPRCRV
ncbi:MAG: hypothetical protein U0996_23970 [Planctomycetaceae bacterium]